MIDPRYQKLAEVIVHYSLEIKPGDKLVVVAGTIAEPLIREVFRVATRAGAYVSLRLGIEGLNEIALKESSDKQLSHLSELTMYEINYFDAMLNIMSDTNTKAMSGVDPKKLAMVSAARAPWLQRYMERSSKGELRWCVTLWPTNAYAQDAGMSLTNYEDFVLSGALMDQPDPVAAWEQVRVDQQHIVDYLNQRNEIHIVAGNTDITYRVGGRIWINADGKRNFPDGEVFTGPIEDSVNGKVSFTYPAVYAGNEVENVQLTFKDGKVVEASAGRGEEFLNAMLDMDAGSRFLGEVAFGLNYGVKQFSRNILFDEKIGGTMHMALGASYPDTGAKNVSALHWDMVCDLREGKVYADGELCYENGKFII